MTAPQPLAFPDPASLGPLRDLAEAAAREAGELALGHFRRGARTGARIWSKAGGSPVTEADLAADRLLQERLSAALPEAGWLSEETTDDPARLGRRLVWVVDPIDGTRAFMNGEADWCVAVALLADARPVIGAIFAPVHRALYAAIAGAGAFKNDAPIAVSPREAVRGARTAGPRPLVDRLERGAGELSKLGKIPSLALRLARVAEGEVECALVSDRAHDWDIAAADLILAEAGGVLTDLAGQAVRYNGPEPVHGELAAASRLLHPRLIGAMRAGGGRKG